MTCRRCHHGIHPQHPDRCHDCHQGRGLCVVCYDIEYRAGRIGQYPTTWRRPGKRDCPHGGKHRHGTAAAYVFDGCGCDPCRQAKVTQNARYVRRAYLNGGPLRLDATGTRRRIQALMRLGWPTEAIARDAGWGQGAAVQQLVRRRYVSPATAARVQATYDRLSMRLGPSLQTRRRAERAGYPAPLDWEVVDIDDPAAVPPPAVDEDRSSTARKRRRVDEYYELRGMGYPDHAIARRWQLRSDAMDRWLQRNIRGDEAAAA